MGLQLPLIVFGNGDLFYELFETIAATLNDQAYGYLIKLMILLTGAWAIIRFSVQRSITPMLRWLALYYAAFYIILWPKATLEILDQIDQQKAYTVANVPLGLAVIASYTSSIGVGLTELIEKTFNLPDRDLSYQKTGMVMASRLLLAATQFQITDANYAQSMQDFIHQCVFYDLLLNKYSWRDLLETTDIWQLITRNPSPARSFAYYAATNGTLETQIISCKEGATLLNNLWKDAITQATTRYGERLFSESRDAKAQLISYLPQSYKFLTQISDATAEGIMRQNIMANTLQNGILHMGTTTNAPAALEAYAFTRAQQQKRLNNNTIGDMAAYWLPIMKNIIEAILYGIFIFVFLLLLFPFGMGVFKKYVISLLWVQMWAPLYAILNFFMNFYAQKHSISALSADGVAKGISLVTQTGLAQVNSDIASLAGYLSLSIPVLAAGIVNGMVGIFSEADQYIADVTGSSAELVNETAAGNARLGNTEFSSHLSHNTEANHFDTNSRVFSGMFTSQLPGGSTLGIAPDSSVVMNNQGGISNLGTSIHLAEEISSQASTHAEKSFATYKQQANIYSNSMQSALSQIYEFGKLQSSVSSNTDIATTHLSADTTAAIHQITQVTDHFAKDHHVDSETAQKALAEAYVSVEAGTPALGILSTHAGAKSEVEVSGTHTDKELFRAAQDYIQGSNFHENIDIAYKAVQGHEFQAKNEQGEQFINNLHDNFTHAQEAKQEMTNSYQQAQQYNTIASYVEQRGNSINSNADQAFMTWLRDEQGMSSESIEQMMLNDPQNAETYAQQFTQEEARKYLQKKRETSAVSPQTIEHSYNDNNKLDIIKGVQVLQQQQNSYEKITQEAKLYGLDKENTVADKTSRNVTTAISENNYALELEKRKIKNKGKKVMDEVNRRN